MTTIAYRDGIIAADSRVTEGSHILPSKYRKVFELPNGDAYAFTGSVAHGMAMYEALVNGVPQKKHPKWDLGDTVSIIVTKKGRVIVYEGEGVWFEQTGKMAAWGSGSDFAYGAMEMGATAEQAVRVAIKHDNNSGGPIRTIEVKRSRKRKQA